LLISFKKIDEEFMSLRLSLEAIEVLDAIARKGSFAAAAESLFRVPSAVTYTVRKLEDDLGVSLFNRTGHRAELTEAGGATTRRPQFIKRRE
jgi:DNA-binding transcriptional LysR family regulator